LDLLSVDCEKNVIKPDIFPDFICGEAGLKCRFMEHEPMNEAHHNNNDELILKVFQGDASSEELAIVESWVFASPENRRHYAHLKNLWDASVNLPLSTSDALQQVITKIKPDRSGKTFWMMWQRVAAIILLPLLIAAAWLLVDRQHEEKALTSAYQTVSTPFGSFTSLELPDGSKVWLNSGSTLRYPSRFGSRSRKVYMQGEAYFEVHSDASSPFLVNTGVLTVRATGTRFNVSSYENDSAATVTLLEGKVSVETPAHGGGTEATAHLLPQDHYTYDKKDGHSTVIHEEPYKYIAWKEGKLVFRNDQLSEVARRISLQYHVEVEIHDPAIRKYRYWATFKNEPLNELLRLLKLTAPIDFRETEPVLLPDGSFSERKIVIYSTDCRKPQP
jgi:transmembrane sensor